MGAGSTACLDRELDPGAGAARRDEDDQGPSGARSAIESSRRPLRSTVVEHWLIERPIPAASTAFVAPRPTLARNQAEWAVTVRPSADRPRRPLATPPRGRRVAGRRSARRRAHRRVVGGASLLVVVVMGVAALSAASGDGPPTDASDRPAPVASVAYVVRAGDTLWSIAREIQPQGDVRPLVDVLSAQRGGAPLLPGDVVAWPPLPTGG
jgi:hypothetical protein